MKLTLALLISAVSAEIYFEEGFNGDWESRWTAGTPSDGKEMGKWEVTPGKWFVDEEVNKGLATTEDMRFHAISAKMDKPSSTVGKDLVIQFSAKYEAHQYAFCGGGYIKLLPEGASQAEFGGADQYQIMFGPDLCGYDVSHIHLIFNHKGTNLLKTEKIPLEYSDKNEFTHLYTAHIKPDGTYEVFFDQKSKATGNLIDDWEFPKKTTDDPSDTKPSTWVDETMIDDPADVKPAGHDDIASQIPDPDATKPEDWDDEDDGEWEPPLIDNPDFKGEWTAKKVDNPAYKGEWKPAQIPNKDFEEGVQLAAYESFYIGFELWIVNNGTIFDNILVTDDLAYAQSQGKKLFEPTSEGEKDAKEKWDKENKPADAPDEEEDEEPEEEEPEKDEL